MYNYELFVARTVHKWKFVFITVVILCHYYFYGQVWSKEDYEMMKETIGDPLPYSHMFYRYVSDTEDCRYGVINVWNTKITLFTLAKCSGSSVFY